ncbi:MAG: putative toxin-antitoxin system toxin component, PIN family [Flavobacteriales bacterium]|nr:putative toxin-antitoxin system toxin component, PIN family [Flavobacteriales bacterium]
MISILIGKELAKLKPMLRSGQVQLVLSPMLLDEFKAVVDRPHLRKYFAPSAVDRFFALVRRTGHFAADVPPTGPISRDPKDDYLLMLAATSGAALLVTGD